MPIFSEPTFYLNKDEYAKIISEINTNYGLYKGKARAVHLSYGMDGMPYIYYDVSARKLLPT